MTNRSEAMGSNDTFVSRQRANQGSGACEAPHEVRELWHRRAMIDSSQGIHPLESYPSQMFCVASATHDFSAPNPSKKECRALLDRHGDRLRRAVSVEISHRVAIATQLDLRFEVQGINPLATFRASLRDAPHTRSLHHNVGCHCFGGDSGVSPAPRM